MRYIQAQLLQVWTLLGYLAEMPVLRIAVLGHPILRQVADPIPVEAIQAPEVQDLIQNMLETMADYEGAGLAAPQVHVSLRLVICVMEEGLRVLVNPVLTPMGDETTSSYEGCLSVPGMRARVTRWAKIRLQGFDHQSNPIDEILQDWNAIVAQHECDHLDGVIYIDRCDTTTLAYEETFRRFGPLDEIEEE